MALSDGPLGEVQAADREIARQTALRARAVARFAADRPATADRAQGEPGAMSAERWATRPANLRAVSEWAGRELVVALSLSAQAADALLTRSLDLVHRLPGTLAALEAGALHPGHLWTMLDKVAPIEDAVIRAEVEAELLRWAVGRVVSPAQLGDKARREVARRDARAAARRLEKALAQRGIHLRPHDVDGMATLTVIATMPEARALHRALVACADSLATDDDPRTRGQKMLDCLLDLVLRPGESELPPVQVLLTVVASIATLSGGDEAGEIDGQVIPAEMVRQFLAALTGVGPDDPTGGDGADHGRPADPIPWQEREQGELEGWWAEMERRVLAGELVDPDPEPCPLSSQDLDGLPLDRDPSPGGTDPELEDGAPGPGDDDLGPGGGELEPTDRRATADRAVDDAGQAPGPPNRWATADRAVDDAGQAVERAHRALARAERAVRTAAVADTADEDAWRAGPGGRVADAADSIAGLRAVGAAQRDLIAELLSTTGGGGLAERPRIALTDALTGALVALTDLPGLRRAGTCGLAACRRHDACCRHDLSARPGVGPPGPTDGYRPSAGLDRFVRGRDRRCRFPGCRRRVPRGGELDHSHPYPAGPTSAGNLAGYCTTDHRGKHQAPGWRHRLDADGTLTVTTPTGLVAVTAPPPY
ncbi:HNH endonuclease [Blastococcus saxobsidens]|uniref:HNH endonuclease n=1 Tax=Blastococcus saxobsidens TaxID=138336 RepID=A0A6L9VZ85_9ACTN|nr:HNH endonuclease [Blastococcus saxobsidens]